MTTGPLAHGMGTELVAPDWSPLTDEEVRSVLSYYPAPSGGVGTGDARITWHSPRPMSSAALVQRGDDTVFVKRHDRRVRSASQLGPEHALARHLRGGGLHVPGALPTVTGESTLSTDGSVYEVHEQAVGVDLYRYAMSWTAFSSLGHARAAGVALARFHGAAATFSRPARPLAVLMSSCEVLTATDPLARVAQLQVDRPGLAGYLSGRRWDEDLGRYHVPVIRRVAPLLRSLPPQWGHGDWHPSNLTWTSARPDAKVAAVFDLGLANRTSAVYDLATALERSTVSWLQLAQTGQARADLDAVAALLDGYQATRPLSAAEWATLPELLPVVHVEYALSEVEYFSDVVHSTANADLTYDTYLIGHTRWFEGPDGSELVDLVRRTARAVCRDDL